jgi:uncharacterized membrane protein (DUF2068 family)
MISPDRHALPPRFGMLRTIAVYKLGKVVLLLFASYGALRLRDASYLASLYNWASALPSGLEQVMALKVIAFFSGLTPARIQALGYVTLAYAAIFAVEGVGLWMRRRWAGWLTTIITASLIPLELWELLHRPTVGKAVVTVVNIAIVWYLLWQLRSTRHAPAGSQNP